MEGIIVSGRKTTALYIVPTRALAFDIRRRFGGLLKERLGIRLAIRTGDKKSAGGGRPDLILTTPESLDVMLGSSNDDLRAFLQHVRTIIIDEVHPFVHQYRGQQLSWLMQRLERRTGRPLQRIALSATIADPDAVCRFLQFKSDYTLLTENVRREIQPRLIHLKDDENELVSLLSDLSEEWKYRKILIFANSRGRCDKIFGLLNKAGAFAGRTLLHYSNLNTRERQSVEQDFRQQERAVCVATSTLELGIDVGDVDAVLLFEPPDSVSAFLQRIGRANRRRNTIHFWGICRGGRAGEQLLRFLALLRLAEEGQVESALSGEMPSVLSQQFISCLYEKKRLSLVALQDLFGTLHDEEIFLSLIKKRWLKESDHKGLYRGGYQYWQAYNEYAIWSNFPENEDQYQLVVGKESVADIPRSVVKQLAPGDRVLLAGRRLKILWIDTDEIKRVLAEPCQSVGDKELVWLGKGSQVSYEVAQAMGRILNSGNDLEHDNIAGLFSRSRELLRLEVAKKNRTVVLENTIEVLRLPNGTYQYRTFIGAVGNLILATAVKEFFAGQDEPVGVQSDEIGLVCSVQISFEKLVLPVTEKDVASWVICHYRMMAAMFPMNAFCTTLSRELLCLELTGFINDPRLLAFFALCKESRSAIMAGDPADLNLPTADLPRQVTQEISSQSEPLLALEKSRLSGQLSPLFQEDDIFQPNALTATIIGEYFRHQQCDRWLGLQFYQKSEQLKQKGDSIDDRLSALRMARGLVFEEAIVTHLQSAGKVVASVQAKDGTGRIRPLARRFAETVRCFELLRENGEDNINHCYLVQPVLHLDSEVLISQQVTLAAVGIPDLVQLHTKPESNGIVLQVGDIKSSSRPRYHQKWQVAFYAWLLQRFLAKWQRSQSARFVVADTGFILTPSGHDVLASRHVFDLKPYLSSMPAAIRKIKKVLCCPPWQSFWQMQKHCLGCSAFDYCYRQAVYTEEVQFIPGIRRGELERMRLLRIRNFQKEFEKSSLQAAMISLQKNSILVEGKNKGNKKTDLFPANISTVLVIHASMEPVSGLLLSIGMFICGKGQEPEKLRWAVGADLQLPALWNEFSSCLLQHWNAAITQNRGPHLLLFGQTTRKGLLNIAERMGSEQLTVLFSGGEFCHYTDLQQLLGREFSLPLPGTITLYGLNRILALLPENKFPLPESLLHEDRFAEIDVHTVCEFLYKLWQWIILHVTGRYYKSEWCLQQHNKFDLSHACLKLVEAEREYQQRDMEVLMEMSLAERIECFRALGPLDFAGTQLDETGKFIYLFTKSMGTEENSENSRNIPAKFRTGDFLRLVPLGVTDLQSGLPVIMAGFNSKTGEVALYPRKRGTEIFKGVKYSLEEDSEDFHSAKVRDVVQRAFTKENYQLIELFAGTYNHRREQSNDKEWLQAWLQSEAAVANLNTSQQQALTLPLCHSVSLISGPPGTGKTHLLSWILIALIRQAQRHGTPLRIAVSALTHKAIDHVLQKLVTLVNRHSLPDFPVRCLKWGRWEGDPFDPDDVRMQVEACQDVKEALNSPYSVIGATGYSLYSMLHKQGGGASSSVKPFDWIIFDEASQILLPQALLSLIHGKGNYLFLGDVCQLPPIIRSQTGEHDAGEEPVRSSVLEFLLQQYPHQNQVLDTTYRMNDAICRFPSKTWYKEKLVPAGEIAGNRLQLKPATENDLINEIINPQKPVALVGIDHCNWSEAVGLEADLLAAISHRLLNSHELEAEQIAILSPHRAQNNSIAESLAGLLAHDDLPVIDTVERMQGAERDVILFGFACTDYDQMFSGFLNNPNRFNVVLTRARQKVIVVGNKMFFESLAATEKQLHDNGCFKEFVVYCQRENCYFQCTEGYLEKLLLSERLSLH
jgi:replicative superfamily II helicase